MDEDARLWPVSGRRGCGRGPPGLCCRWLLMGEQYVYRAHNVLYVDCFVGECVGGREVERPAAVVVEGIEYGGLQVGGCHSVDEVGIALLECEGREAAAELHLWSRRGVRHVQNVAVGAPVVVTPGGRQMGPAGCQVNVYAPIAGVGAGAIARAAVFEPYHRHVFLPL